MKRALVVIALVAGLTATAARAGVAAPAFALRSLEGRTVRLSDFRGKVVLLNFWATWCGGCRVEMPWLIEIYRQYRSQGLEIIGVSMDDGGEEVIAKFTKAKNVNYTIVKGNEAVANAYGKVQLLPQTFLINRDGTVAGHFTGVPDRRELENTIRRILSPNQK
ncbi:MAG TPA: TlpA disulfide reductase family protein [Thermoanaerobaculia bacterium]|nr:TlpA disulfide reductase family protein [Thermoanaerobaculia bacterium]